MASNKENEEFKGKYLQASLDMAKAYRIINEIPLDWFIEVLDKSLAFTPLFDPTLFMSKSDDGERWMRIARALKGCRDKIAGEFSS